MPFERTGVVIDLFSRPRTQQRPSRDPAPEKGSAPDSAPERELAPIIEIFSSKASEERHFGRIKDILAARLKWGRLFLELYIDGPALPFHYLRSLTYTIDDPLTGISATFKIEAVKVKDGHYVALRSEPLEGAPRGPATLNTDAVVRITSPSGQMIQNLLHPLLDARP